MAEIPIEKKGGIAWWVWALVAAVVVALVIWLLLGNDRNIDAIDANEVATSPILNDAAGATASSTGAGSGVGAGPLTDLASLGAGNDASLIGRDVALTNVSVGDVPGDASFWIVGEQGEKHYVVLDEVRTPDTPIEGRVDIDPGDRIDLTGTIRAASDGAPPTAAIGTPTDPIPADVTQYIYAQSAQVRN